MGDTGASPPPPNELERLLEIARAITAATTAAGSLAGALEATVDELFALSGHQGVTGTLIDHEAGEQVVVADRARRANTALGHRRPIGEGLIGAVVTSHQQLLMGDAGDDPRYSWDADTQVFHSLLLTPVVVDGRCEAVLELADTERDRYGEADATLLRIAADQLAATLRGIRLREQSERRARSLDVAARVAQSVAAATTVEQALELAARATHRTAGFRRVAATLVLDETGEQLHLVEVGPPRPFTPVRRPLGSGPVGIALTTQQPVRTTGEDGPLLVVPVVVEGKAVAALDVVEAGDTFDPADSALMTLVAEQLAAAWRSLRHRDESERRAHRLALASEVAKLVTSSGPLDEMLQDVARTVCDHTGYDSVTIAMADRAAGVQVYVADESRREPSQTGLRRPLDAGICGRTLRTGLPFRSGRADGDPAYDWQSDEPYRSAIVTPVNVDGECVAAVGAWTQEQHRFDAWDEVTMETIAEQLAIAISARRLREQSERRAHRLALSLDVARAIVGAETIDATLQAAVNALFDTLGCTTVNAVRADGDEQVLVAVRTAAGGRPIGLRRPRTEGMSGHVFATGQIVRESSQPPADRISRWTGEHNHESGLIVPVLVDGVVMAVLELYDVSTDRFEAQDELLMRAVAEQVAAALRGARLRGESEQRARRLALASDIARRIAAAESADDVVRTAVRLVHESTGCTSVAGIRVSSDRSEQIFTAVIDGRGDTRLEGRRRPAGEGLVGVALSTARQVSVGRSSLSDVYAWPGSPRLESLIVTPVLVDGVCVAALHVADLEPDRFDETEASLLRAVAEQVAAALRGARLRAESERRAGRLAVTLQVATAVAGERTVDSTLRAAVRAIAASIEAHAFAAFIPLLETGEQECVIAVDPVGGVEAERRPLEGITTGAVLTGAGQVSISDTRTHDGYRPWREDSPYRSVLLTPVVIDDRVAAAIGLYSLEPHRFNADDAVLMRTLAEQVAAALRGARLRDESERRARRLAVTLDVARAVADAPAIEDALRSAVETVADAIHCGSVAGFMALPETAEQLCVIDIDRHGASVQGMRQPLFAGHNGMVFRSGRQLHLRKQDDAPPGLRWTADDWEYQSAVFTPVQLAGHTVAVITLTDTAVGRFDDDDALLMRTVAEQLAAALRGASLRDESERRARRLALTLEVAKAVATAATPVETLRSAVEAIDTHIDCGAVAAFLAEHETEEQVSIVDIDRHGNSTEGMRQPMDEGTTGRVFETGRQLVLGNSAGADGFVPWRESGSVYESVLITPVAVNGRCDAVLGLYDIAADRFDAEDALLMETVAEQVAAALRGARLRDQSESRARRLEALERRQRELLARLVRAQEQERTQVAGDLHDDTVQVLSACVIALDRVRHAIEAGELDRASASLRQAASLVSGAVERTRRMTFELRPAMLWQHGLEPAVRHLLDALARETRVEVRLDIGTLPGRLDSTVEAIAFRSISELIANVRTHAEAEQVVISLSADDGRLQAEVLDDGRGFNLEQALERARATNHLGLEALTERIDAAGGSVEIVTSPGDGTRVSLSLPLRTASAA